MSLGERQPVADIAWYHTIDLGGGVVTPGYYDCRPVAARVPWPASLAGARCLDVGTFDGFWAFEMERRGAREVVAIDVDDPEALDWPVDARRSGPESLRRVRSIRGPGFETARAALGSRVERRDLSAYDLSPESAGRFDVVMIGALLLHLRDPVRALEAVRSVTAGTLLVAEMIDPALQALVPRVPAARLNGLGTDAQWWILNAAGLERLLRSAGFRVTGRTLPFVTPFGRSPWIPPGAFRRRARNALLTGRARDGAPTVALRARPAP